MESKTSDKILKIMDLLGCEEIRPGIFRPPASSDFYPRFWPTEIDMSATHEDCVLIKLAGIFTEIGFKACQQNIEIALGRIRRGNKCQDWK